MADNESTAGADLRADDPVVRSEAGRALGSVTSDAKKTAVRANLEKAWAAGRGRKKGQGQSEETKAKISAARKAQGGQPRSEETKARMREAHARRRAEKAAAQPQEGNPE